VVVLIGDGDDKVSVVTATNAPARERGLSANALLRELAPVVGGRGGGKDDLAQGGGSDATRIDEALGLVPGLVAKA
jgi:alanyl-tRNA synthetase